MTPGTKVEHIYAPGFYGVIIESGMRSKINVR